jgi:hypothetical protein
MVNFPPKTGQQQDLGGILTSVFSSAPRQFAFGRILHYSFPVSPRLTFQTTTAREIPAGELNR